MNKKIGFIGCGNMAQAMIKGILKSEIVDKKNIFVSANTEETLKKVKLEYGVSTSRENSEVASGSDILILAVKPHLYENIIYNTEVRRSNHRRTFLGLTTLKHKRIFSVLTVLVHCICNWILMFLKKYYIL